MANLLKVSDRLLNTSTGAWWKIVGHAVLDSSGALAFIRSGIALLTTSGTLSHIRTGREYIEQTPSATSALLLESGSFLLLESGDKLLQE